MASRVTLEDVSVEQRSHTNKLATQGADIKELKASLLRALLRIDGLQAASGLTLDGSGNLVITSADVFADDFDGDALILDEYIEMSGSSAAAVSPSGTGRIRYNESTHVFEQSLNGAAWSALGGGGSATIQDEGTPLAGSPHTTYNFVGAGVSVANAGGGVATITIAGNVVDTLQATYDAGAATVAIAAAKPVRFTNALGDGTNTFELTKEPGSAQAGHAISAALNANATGAGLYVQHDGLATEQNHGTGLWLNNTTVAANGAQQVSPDVRMTGRAWESDTSTSRQHDWVFRVFPTQGTATTTSAISIRHRIDAAAFATLFQINNSGQFITGLGTAALPTIAVGPTIGMFGVSSAQLGWAVSGVQRMSLAASVLTVDVTAAARGPDGTSSLPGWSFTGATGMGMYRATNVLGLRGTSNIELNIGGTAIASVSSSAFSPSTTAVTSLGQSGLRWTTIYGQAVDISQAVAVGGTSGPALKVTGAAHTTQTAGAEIVDLEFALNRTIQHATGTLANQRSVIFNRPTHSFVGASTITKAATVTIVGPPLAGTNATITAAWALDIETGNLNVGGLGQFGGRMLVTTNGSDPAYSETTDPDTGIQFAGGNVLDIWCGGAASASFTTSLVTVTPALVASTGIRFSSGETTTKLYRDAANSIAIDVSGAEFFRIRSDGARFSRSVRTVPVVLTDGATVTPDVALSNQYTWTIGGNRTLANPSNIVAGMQWQIDVTQDGTGGRTITWGSSYVTGNGGTMSSVQPESGASRVTIFTFKAITTTKIAVLKSDWY